MQTENGQAAKAILEHDQNSTAARFVRRPFATDHLVPSCKCTHQSPSKEGALCQASSSRMKRRARSGNRPSSLPHGRVLAGRPGPKTTTALRPNRRKTPVPPWRVPHAFPSTTPSMRSSRPVRNAEHARKQSAMFATRLFQKDPSFASGKASMSLRQSSGSRRRQNDFLSQKPFCSASRYADDIAFRMSQFAKHPKGPETTTSANRDSKTHPRMTPRRHPRMLQGPPKSNTDNEVSSVGRHSPPRIESARFSIRPASCPERVRREPPFPTS